MEATGPVTARFPLVSRPRPPCTSLDQRTSALRARAEAATADADPVAASAVLNQAALIASDCGDPELARQWCHRHASAYLCAGLTGAQAARNIVEPLVNLARLRIRAGDGDTAYTMLDTLLRAVTDAADITLDGLDLPTGGLIRTDDDRRTVRQWLWAVHLAEGTRALTTANRWHDALHHLHRHNGIGDRMFDGRQVAVITAHIDGDDATVKTLLDTTEPGEPAENAVTACLRHLCAPTNMRRATRAAMWHRYGAVEPAAGTAVFHTRLTLSVVDSVGGPDDPRVVDALVDRIVNWADGYAARDLLGHRGLAAGLAESRVRALAATVDAAALDAGEVPPDHVSRLTTAVNQAEAVILSSRVRERPTAREEVR